MDSGRRWNQFVIDLLLWELYGAKLDLVRTIVEYELIVVGVQVTESGFHFLLSFEDCCKVPNTLHGLPKSIRSVRMTKEIFYFIPRGVGRSSRLWVIIVRPVKTVTMVEEVVERRIRHRDIKPRCPEMMITKSEALEPEVLGLLRTHDEGTRYWVRGSSIGGYAERWPGARHVRTGAGRVHRQGIQMFIVASVWVQIRVGDGFWKYVPLIEVTEVFAPRPCRCAPVIKEFSPKKGDPEPLPILFLPIEEGGTFPRSGVIGFVWELPAFPLLPILMCLWFLDPLQFELLPFQELPPRFAGVLMPAG
jgi:hypothetical protein